MAATRGARRRNAARRRVAAGLAANRADVTRPWRSSSAPLSVTGCSHSRRSPRRPRPRSPTPSRPARRCGRSPPRTTSRRALSRPTTASRWTPRSCSARRSWSRRPSRATRRSRAPGSCRRSRRGASARAGGQGGYTVQPGDTLSGIAAGAGISVGDLAAANGLDPAGILVAGTTLSVAGGRSGAGARPDAAPPAQGAYTVRPGDTLSGLAAGPASDGRHGRDERPRPDRRAARRHGRSSCRAAPPRPPQASEPAPAPVVPAGRPRADGHTRGRRRHPLGRRRARRLALARRRDRVAGERLQQRDGLVRQRARRHAGDAGHVGLDPGQPRASAPLDPNSATDNVARRRRCT